MLYVYKYKENLCFYSQKGSYKYKVKKQGWYPTPADILIGL